MRRARLTTGLTALFCFLGGFALAEGPSVEVTIQPRTIHVNDRFMISVRITGNRIQKVDMPQVGSIHIDGSPSNQSQSIEIQNGVTQRSVQLGYGARALRKGRVTLPPVNVTIDGKVYKSDPVVFNVLAADQNPPPQPPPPPPPPRGGRPSPQSSQQKLGWDDVVFVRSKTDKKEVYQGEAVKLTLSYWELNNSALDVRPLIDLGHEQIPAVGFYVSDIGSRRYADTYQGRPYIVEEYTKVLYPTGSGDLTIGPWKFQGLGRWLANFNFQTHQYAISTDPIHIKVKPLPARPDDFSGAVGTFKVTAMLSRAQVVVGAPADFVVTVHGEGNPESIGAPKLPKIAKVHVSGPESNVTPLNSQGELAMEKTFKYHIIPNVPGKLKIPPVQFVYFDPSQAQYITEKTDPFELNVTPSPDGQQRIVVDGSDGQLEQKQQVAVLNSDIMPLATDPGPLYPRHNWAWLLGLALVGPALGYGAFAAYMARKRRFERDSRLARSHFARSRGRKRLAEVNEADDPAQALYRALMGFIADKFDVHEEGLTSDDVRRLLAGAPLDEAVVESIIKTLKACERARYASAKLSPHEMTALLEASEMNMNKIEESLKKGIRA